ncbi:MAG TPA: hypothetical protein VN774_01345, partial [Candidatus Limnocylindrales bacterium]|nr:hypothetical protein [Candidatus Limnocylindrales bacterium]
MGTKISISGFIIMTMAVAAAGYGPVQTAPQTVVKKDFATLVARDTHQGVTVAADPWMQPEDYKTRFGKKTPYDAGVIAIDIYFHNDGTIPLRVNLDTIRLTLAFEGQPEQDLPPLRAENVADYILNQSGAKKSRRLSLPIGGGKPNKQMNEMTALIRENQLATDLIPPKGTVNGFLYFDLGGEFDYIKSAKIYVPDLKEMETDKTLFFFDVPLAK